MVDLLINLMIVMFVYVALYTIYWCVLVFAARKEKRFTIKQRYSQNAYSNNLVVMIYAQNNEKTVVPLLEMLNKQNYSRQNYDIHIILDNCTDNSSNVLEFIGGAKIWKVGEDNAMGKDEAISWLLERLISFQNVNAFVFLNANRIVDENFLSSINTALFDKDVITGSTEFVFKEKTLKNFILEAFNNYCNRIVKTGRAILGLGSILDSDITVIKQSVLEKIKCVDFKDINSELKYSILLAKNGYIPNFNPTIKTFIEIENYNSRKPSLTYKLNLFAHCLPMIFNSKIKFSELLFNTITPNIWVILLVYMGLLAFTSIYYFVFDFPVILTFALIFITSLIASLFVAKIPANKIIYLVLYPFYSLFKMVKNIPFIKKLFKVEKDFSGEVNEKLTVDVCVTDGKNNILCKLDLISEDGLAKAVFKFKNKKYTSDSFIRMFDAIKNISEKLEQYGFKLKICQNCMLFTSKIDGSTNMVKGFCNCENLEFANDNQRQRLLWNTCDCYVPVDVSKVIDFKSYQDGNKE